MAHTGTAQIDIAASIDDCFAVVTDLEAYPDWLRDVKDVDVLEVDEHGRPLASTMTVDVSIRMVTYTLDYTYVDGERMAWTSRPGGDVRSIEGSYAFEVNDDGSTSVTYELEIDPGFPVPGFMVRKAARHITGQALDGLKARAEAAA